MSAYLPLSQRDRRIAVANLITSIEAQHANVGGIVVTGLSGLLVGPAVADGLGVGLVVVRRAGEEGHHGKPVELERGIIRDGRPLVFVDDQIETGRTFRWARRAIRQQLSYPLDIAAFYMSLDDEDLWDWYNARMPSGTTQVRLTSCATVGHSFTGHNDPMCENCGEVAS
jgi:adenine/guanine phosphoribosyltransferase-like PRPP-binding protein